MSAGEDTLELPRWVRLWFWVTIPIIVWDAAFILCRPASLPGGSLWWIWAPYDLYLATDQRYTDLTDDFVVAQSMMNLVEGALGALALWGSAKRRKWCTLLAFSVSLMTLAKTVLYYLVEAAGGFANVDSAPTWSLVLFFGVMNGLWIVVPLAIVHKLGRRLLPS